MPKISPMRREPTHLQIAQRAFEIYIARGGDHGQDVGDWFEAERQLAAELRPDKTSVKRPSTRRRGGAYSKGEPPQSVTPFAAAWRSCAKPGEAATARPGTPSRGSVVPGTPPRLGAGGTPGQDQ